MTNDSCVEDKRATTTGARELLRPAGDFTFPATDEVIVPKEVFRSREGLSVEGHFLNDIVVYTRALQRTREVTVHAFDLVTPANDTEIRQQLPEGHVFGNPSEFCAILYRMIENQSNGEEGALLSDGDYSTFSYVQAIGRDNLVCVRWDVVRQEWRVSAPMYDNPRRRVRNRVFSAAA